MRLSALATWLSPVLSTKPETFDEYIVLQEDGNLPEQPERDIVEPISVVSGFKWVVRMGVSTSIKATASTLLSAANVAGAAGAAVHSTARAFEVEQELGVIVKLPSMVLEGPVAGLRGLAHGLEVTGEIVADGKVCQYTELARIRMMTVGRPGAFVTALHNRIGQRRRNGASTDILEQELHDYI